MVWNSWLAPWTNGWYIQDSGISPRSLPLVLTISLGELPGKPHLAELAESEGSDSPEYPYCPPNPYVELSFAHEDGGSVDVDVEESVTQERV